MLAASGLICAVQGGGGSFIWRMCESSESLFRGAILWKVARDFTAVIQSVVLPTMSFLCIPFSRLHYLRITLCCGICSASLNTF